MVIYVIKTLWSISFWLCLTKQFLKTLFYGRRLTGSAYALPFTASTDSYYFCWAPNGLVQVPSAPMRRAQSFVRRAESLCAGEPLAKFGLKIVERIDRNRLAPEWTRKLATHRTTDYYLCSPSWQCSNKTTKWQNSYSRCTVPDTCQRPARFGRLHREAVSKTMRSCESKWKNSWISGLDAIAVSCNLL